MEKTISRVWVGAFLVGLLSSATSIASERKIGVTGECTRSATPDRGEITVIATFRDKDIKTAIRNTTEAYEHALEAVKKLSLADLEVETSEYNAHEVREWEKDRQVLKGYEARMGLRVSTSSVGLLGQVIAIAAQHGLKEVGQLRMFLSDAKLNTEKAACLKNAAENAKSKANELAAALHAKLGKVFSIQESGAKLDPIRPMAMAMMAADTMMSKSANAPPVEGGKQQVSISVEVVFELE